MMWVVVVMMMMARRCKGRSRDQEHEGEDDELFHTSIVARVLPSFE